MHPPFLLPLHLCPRALKFPLKRWFVFMRFRGTPERKFSCQERMPVTNGCVPPWKRQFCPLLALISCLYVFLWCGWLAIVLLSTLECPLLSLFSSFSGSQVNETAWLQLLSFLGDTISQQTPRSPDSQDLSTHTFAVFPEPQVWEFFCPCIHWNWTPHYALRLVVDVHNGLHNKPSALRHMSK